MAEAEGIVVDIVQCPVHGPGWKQYFISSVVAAVVVVVVVVVVVIVVVVVVVVAVAVIVVEAITERAVAVLVPLGLDW